MATVTPFNSSNLTSSLAYNDSGDNAWQLTAASLVQLQSIPGLVVFYAGIMKKKWAVNSAFMAFYAFAATVIIWSLLAYSMGFGVQAGNGQIIGTPYPTLTMDWELSQAQLPAAAILANYPMATMVWFQGVFAAITIVILAGALLGRMNPFAWMLFVPLWILLSYTFGAFSVWAGGWAFQLGVIDYSGGYVIHLSSGTAGFVAAYWVGPRLHKDKIDNQPNNLLFMMTGIGILWTGWNGFNGGDPYAASPDAGVAVLNTNLCTAASCLVWMVCDIIYYKKPSLVGMCQGVITGLVAITPCAGVIDGWAALLLGFLSGTIPWLSMNVMGKKVRFFQYVDDTLGVFHTHMVAGFLGGFFVGIFATADGCLAFASLSPGGAITGNGRQVWVQIVGALFIIGWNIFMTSFILLTMKYVLRIPLRMSEEALLLGDDAVHGEEAYRFYYEGEASSVSIFGHMHDRNDSELGLSSGQQSPLDRPMGGKMMNNGKTMNNGVATHATDAATPGYDSVAPGEHAAKTE